MLYRTAGFTSPHKILSRRHFNSECYVNRLTIKWLWPIMAIYEELVGFSCARQRLRQWNDKFTIEYYSRRIWLLRGFILILLPILALFRGHIYNFHLMVSEAWIDEVPARVSIVDNQYLHTFLSCRYTQSDAEPWEMYGQACFSTVSIMISHAAVSMHRRHYVRPYLPPYRRQLMLPCKYWP